MKKKVLWSLILLVLILLILWLNQIMKATTERENIVRQEMQSYLNEKYAENMIVKNTSVMDGKVGVAYVSDKPDITFNIFGGYKTTKDFTDTFLSRYLAVHTEEYIKDVLLDNGYNNISISLLYTHGADEKLYEYYKKYKRPVMFYELKEDLFFAHCTIFYENNCLSNDDMDTIYKLIDDLEIPISKRDNGELALDFLNRNVK